MKKVALSYLLLALLAFSGYSQEKDVPGWQEARWGMTEQQLLTAFKTDIKKLPKRMTYNTTYADYGILDYEIDGQKYNVYFQMSSETNKLSGVLVSHTRTKSRTPLDIYFNNLDALLTRQYGAAGYQKDEHENGVISLDRKWSFPTTTIKLGYSWLSGINFSLLFIRYYPTGKEPDKI